MNPTFSSSSLSPRPAMRGSSKLIVGCFVLCVLFGAWLVWYAQDKGFTAYWRHRVEAEFEQRGVYASMRRLNLDPLRGLTAKDVLVYEDPERQTLLMKIDDVALNVDFSALFGGRLTLNAFEVRNARITLPLDPKPRLEGDQLVLDNLSARVLISPGRIEIIRAEALVNDLTIRLSGALDRSLPGASEDRDGDGLPDDPSSGEEGTESNLETLRKRRHLIAAVLDYLDSVEFGDVGAPVLDVHLQGIAGQEETIQARGKLQTQALRVAHFECDKLSADWSYRGGMINIDHIELVDRFGRLESQCEYDLATRQLRFALNSTVDLPGFLRGLIPAPLFNEVVFYMPPRIVASGTYDFAKPFSWTDLPIDVVGQLEAERTTSRGVIFEAIACDFSARGAQLYLRNGRLEHKTGILNLDLIRDANGVQYQADLRLHPTVFGPFLKLEGSRDFLKRWTFTDDSAVFIHVNGSGSEMKPVDWNTTGKIDIRNCRLNDHPIDQLQADIHFEGQLHHYRNLVISRPEGSIQGEQITLDHGSNIYTFHGIQGRVFPVHAVGWFAPEAAQHLVVYDFDEPPELLIEGTLDSRPDSDKTVDGPRHDYSIRFASEGMANYELFNRILRLESPRGEVRIKNDTIRLVDFEAGVLGGQLQVEVTLNQIHENLAFEATVSAGDLDFRQLAELYSTYKDTEGRLSGFARFTGSSNGLSDLASEGSVTIIDGNVFSIPTFGPLSRALEEVLPRFHAGLSVAKEARLDYSIRDAIFTADAFAAHTQAFQLKGAGDVDLRTQEMDLLATINLRGPAGTVLVPVSKLLEFRSEGSIRDPVWRPRNVPPLQSPLRDIVEGASEGLRKLSGKNEDDNDAEDVPSARP